MQRQKKERWLELCAQAAEEQDPKKLLELVTEINRLLEEKERRLGITPPRLRLWLWLTICLLESLCDE